MPPTVREDEHLRSAINGLNTATSISPELFSSLEEFTARVERMIDMTKSGARVTGVHEILIRGEAEQRERDRNIKEGVPVKPVAHRSLLKYAEAATLEARLVIVR
jgi:LDH2 family malate/lactate/ureidoglycolate dehydrogenase